jgi:hypothetical protein
MTTKHTPKKQPRKRIRRAALADLFGVHIRTVDLWAKVGTLPAPHYLPGSRTPLWFEDEIPNADRA